MLICYRCREQLREHGKKPYITCKYCTVSWHIDCLIQPSHTPIPDTLDWRCPQHQERAHTTKQRVKGKDGRTVKVQHTSEDITFHEAENIVKYGGVVYGIPTWHIENEFLDFAAKRRRAMTLDRDYKDSTEEWINSLPVDFPVYKTKEQQQGVEMLLEAAHHVNTNKRQIELDEDEYKRMEAIDQLIKLKGGEDELLKILSSKTNK